MEWPKWKAEQLVIWRESRPMYWSRRAWAAAKIGAAAVGRLVAAGSRLVLAWLRAHPTVSVALGVFGVIAVLLGPVLWVVGGWALIQETTARALTAFRSISDPEKTVEAYGKLIGAVGLLVAAPVGLLGVGLAFWRTWNQHRDGVLAARKLEAESYAKAAEAFAKAVDHLGNDKPSVRMGAVLALEALGKATPRLLSQAIEILCAYVRESQPASILPSASNGADAAVFKAKRLPTDIQLIVTIVDRLKRQDVDGLIRIDFSNANLSKANLSRANLSNANLNGTCLDGANLRGANLCGANLRLAKLSKANLRFAKLNDAILRKSDLTGADLRRANLTDADLIEADLSTACLMRANLSGADLTDADLSNADLNKANLAGTVLRGANLMDANLTDSNPREADVREADLRVARLTDSQAVKTNRARKIIPEEEV